NAVMHDARHAARLLDAELDSVRLTFDGASKETDEKYRVGAVFEKTRENILNFLRKKLERKSPVYVVVQMILLKENTHEIDAYRKLWSIRGIDEIRFKRDEIQTDTTKLPGVEFRSQRRHPCHLLWRWPMYVRYDG